MTMDDLREWIDDVIAKAPEYVVQLDEDLFYVHQPPRTACWCCGRVLAIDAVLVFNGSTIYMMKKSVCMPPGVQDECPYSAEGSEMSEGTCNNKDRSDAACLARPHIPKFIRK